MDFPSEHIATFKSHLRRAPWRDFPAVILHADESSVKRHSSYSAAKGGDEKAAADLVIQLLARTACERLATIARVQRPTLLAVHAQENQSVNMIPRAMSEALAGLLAWPLANGIVQLNRVSHTGAGGYFRLAYPAD